MGTGTAAATRDGRTLSLSDGREVRLAGIEADDDSRAALQALTAEHTLWLESLGAAVRDRYGRVVAFVFVGDDQQSVQDALLDQGRARVSARVGERPVPTGF